MAERKPLDIFCGLINVSNGKQLGVGEQLLVAAPDEFSEKVLRCCGVIIGHGCAMKKAVDRVCVTILNRVAATLDASRRIRQDGVEAGMIANSAGKEVSITHKLGPDNGRFLYDTAPKETSESELPEIVQREPAGNEEGRRLRHGHRNSAA